MNELAGLLIGFVLTLFIFSYLLGDNPLYKLAVHILVGMSAAYAAIVVVDQVLLPIYRQLQADTSQAASLRWLVPAIFAVLLILKRLPAIGWLGNSAIALLVGVGAAVALTGAIGGTLIPQIGAFGRLSGNGLSGIGQQTAVAFFTAVTLLSFQFIGRKNKEGEWSQPVWFKGLTHLGRGVLMITFGALFAGVLNTGIILLSERIAYFLNQFWQLLT